MLPLTASSATYDWVMLKSNKQPQITQIALCFHRQQKLGIKVGSQYFGCRTSFPNQPVHYLSVETTRYIRSF